MKKQEFISSIVKEAKWVNSSISKTADFPSLFMQLKPEERTQISQQYNVGPKSTQEEIPIDKADKKPYKDLLLVYTTSVLSEKEQQDAQGTIRKKQDEFYKSPEYQKLHGSQAGKELWEAKKLEIEKEINSKLTPAERPVAWGIGINFNVNRKLFKYHWSRRGRTQWSDEPKNRKDLIEYIAKNGGKVYVISQDADLQALRQKRREQAPVDRTYQDNPYKIRAKLYLQKKLPAIQQAVDKIEKTIGDKILQNFENAFLKMKNDPGYGIDIGRELMNGVSVGKLNELSHLLYDAIKSSPTVSDANDLKRFVAQVNEALA